MALVDRAAEIHPSVDRKFPERAAASLSRQKVPGVEAFLFLMPTRPELPSGTQAAPVFPF